MRLRALCVRAFPRAWRERYGAELIALLAESPGRNGWSESADLIRAGLGERARVSDRRGRWRTALALPVALAAAVTTPAVLAPAVSGPVAVSPMTVAVVVRTMSVDGAAHQLVRRLPVRAVTLWQPGGRGRRR